MTKLAQSLCLDLTDTLTGDIKLLAHLFQCSGTTVIQAKTKCQYFFLMLGQRIKYFSQLLFQKCKRCCVCRNRYIVVLNEITQM